MSENSNQLKNLFCAKPFEYLDIHFVDGQLRFYFCCPTWLPNYITVSPDQNWQDLWNHPEILKIRQSILDGNFKYCDQQLCPEIQSQTLDDRRFTQNKYHRQLITDNQVTLQQSPKIINFSEDHTCNLTCPSCRTQAIIQTPDEYELIKQFHQVTLPSLLTNCERILLCSAGDPFASPLYREMLYNLDGQDFPHLKITLITNGVLLTPKTWEKMAKLHKNIDQVFISLDAASEATYNQVRRGGNFKTVINNIKFLSNLLQTGQLEDLKLDFVVQDNNFHEMIAFVKLGIQLKVRYIYFQRISNWGTFTAEEFQQKDICNPNHPLHQDFLQICKNSIFTHPIVRPGNLASYFPKSKKTQFINFLKRFTLLRTIRIKLISLSQQLQSHF